MSKFNQRFASFHPGLAVYPYRLLPEDPTIVGLILPELKIVSSVPTSTSSSSISIRRTSLFHEKGTQ